MSEYLPLIEAIIIGIVAGFAISFVLRIAIRMYVLYRLAKILQGGQELTQMIENKLIVLDIELDNQIFFCYDSTNDKKFICQGATVAEVRKEVKRQYPNKFLAISDNTDKAILEQFRKEYREATIEDQPIK